MSTPALAPTRPLLATASAATTNSLGTSVRQLDTAVKGQSSDTITIQNFCLSVAQQGSVNLAQYAHLAQYGAQINQGLVTAQNHANLYLNQISPNIIGNISNIQNYYMLHQSIPSVLPPGSSVSEWVSNLQQLQQASAQYQASAASVAQSIEAFRAAVSSDSKAFAGYVQNLNNAAGGDDGVLNTISGELGSLQSKVDGAIAGIAISGIAILGGVFLTLVGGIADFVTAGTSTPLVMGGVAVICAGVGGEVASSLSLKALLDAQGNLLREQVNLKSEVKTALGISVAYKSLENKAAAAAKAALDMQNAWNFLTDNLGALASDLQKGILNPSHVLSLWLIVANGQLARAQQDINVIQSQMSGVKTLTAPAGTTIGDFAVATAQQAAA